MLPPPPATELDLSAAQTPAFPPLYVEDSDKPVSLTLTVPAVGLIALATGNLDAARSNGLTTEGDERQLTSLFSVLQPGDRGFNIVEP
jgi:alkyl sulfatase BDS1-like metallo-beta-lactamase superfamily hydrolase